MKPTDTALYSAFDAVINTAPAAVIPTLEGFKKSCLLLELASAPGGIDKRDAIVVQESAGSVAGRIYS